MAGLWIDFVMLTIILYLISWLPEKFHGRRYFVMFRVWCRAFVRALDVDLKLHQKNRFPLPKQYILIANHPSAFEDIGIPALFDVYSLAKVEVKKWWIVGRMSKAAGTVYVNRESRDSRRDAAIELQQEIIKGRNVGLYPEGGCKGKRIFEDFRYGAFDVAMKTAVPILPVFIHYEAQDDFEWRGSQTLIDKLVHFLTTQNSTANYYVFDAIDPGAFKTKEEFTDYVWQLYIKWQEKYLE
jgi:1-acyl-sn-glycerol-3-phosphate acyltransferase